MNGNVKRIRNTEWNILFYIRSTVTEKVIPQIEKKREKFTENPIEFGSIVMEVYVL